MRARLRFAAVVLMASLALAGCGSGASNGSSADSKEAAAGEAAAGGAAKGPAPDSAHAGAQPPGGKGQQTAVPQTHVIRTAELHVEVKDATAALASVRTAVEGAGGHVADESTERIDDTQVTSRVVLRVPQDRYATLLTDLAGTGKLLSRKADAKDVTGQVVDVESRIATQRASVARVRALMDRAEQLSDVVTLEGELSRRQAELESLLAQQASLKDRTTMATITLELSEPEKKEQAKTEDDPGFLDALSGGWNALVTTLRWIVVVLGAAAPFLLAFAVAYAVWRFLVRPRLRGRTARGPAPRKD
ncbi:DUF4349 domain-containing protein [Streptomyces sp. NBC_00259]|uniref:DUF4349 domain-containing protein n=1 Tax=Streptomyces sp. NBC_00259 TaxID=2903643 RepID=UPI002E2843D7|nr:DUF4349 domain-containing protein [Streptomyces sp. NBC_00259]